MGNARYDYELLRQAGERLRALRKAKGLSQEKVYLDTGLNLGWIEVGKKNVSLTTLSILCTYYGVTLEAFFRGIEATDSLASPK